MISYEAFGESKTLNAWANDERCVVSRKALEKRLIAGMSLEQALILRPSTKGSLTGAKGNLITAFGEAKSVLAWSQDPRCQVSRTMLRKRLEQGVAPEEALSKGASWYPTFGAREAFGELKTLAEWSRDSRCVVTYQTLQGRISKSWNLEEAITTRLAIKPQIVEAFGESKSVNAWAKSSKVSAGVLRKRIRQGVSPEVALSAPLDEILYEAWGEKKRILHWTRDSRCVVKNPGTLFSRINEAGMPVEEALTMPLGELSSYLEKKLAVFVESLGVSMLRNDRRIIGPKELDIVIPAHRLAIEFNGIKWHDEDHVDPMYHYDKWYRCRRKGIQLLQVWEDDYLAKRDLIHGMIAHKLGRGASERVFARKTTVATVDYGVASGFLRQHHIQGAIGATVHVGLGLQILKREDVPVAVGIICLNVVPKNPLQVWVMTNELLSPRTFTRVI